jgi:hypothetical protein
MEKLLAAFSGFHQMVFSVLTAHIHNNFFHSSQSTVAFFYNHRPTAQPNRPLDYYVTGLKPSTRGQLGLDYVT